MLDGVFWVRWGLKIFFFWEKEACIKSEHFFCIEELFVRVEWLRISIILKNFLKFPESESRDFYKLDSY